jgi:dUTP pyrophosphatase
VSLQVLFTRLDPDVALPKYAHPGDAGADICSSVDMVLMPGQRAAVPTGLAIAFPEGYVALAHPRSGLALKNGIGMVNAPGTIDAGYRGELKVLLINHSDTPFEIKRGDRIAQLVFQKVENATFQEVAELPESVRGDGGFGSTGVRS